jgi:muramoyltetrapeptide carboxypeptidase
MITSLAKPSRLRPGATVGIATPSSPSHVDFRERFEHALDCLRKAGLQVKLGSLTARCTSEGYRSGPPRERAGELMELFLDPEVDAIITTIGGTNSSSLLPFLDYAAIRRNPKIFCGYSDVTALHLALYTQAGLSTFYGPAIVPSFGEWPEPIAYTMDSFLAATRQTTGARTLLPPTAWSNQGGGWSDGGWKTKPRVWHPHPGWKCLREGRASGPVVCMNLNTSVGLAGTRYFPDLAGHILLLEEMHCPLARYERHLRQFQLMGVFERISGLIVSRPEIYDQQGAPFTPEDLLLEIMGAASYPVITDFDCGHCHPMITLAQGVQISMNCNTDSVGITVDEPMVI